MARTAIDAVGWRMLTGTIPAVGRKENKDDEECVVGATWVARVCQHVAAMAQSPATGAIRGNRRGLSRASVPGVSGAPPRRRAPLAITSPGTRRSPRAALAAPAGGDADWSARTRGTRHGWSSELAPGRGRRSSGRTIALDCGPDAASLYPARWHLLPRKPQAGRFARWVRRGVSCDRTSRIPARPRARPLARGLRCGVPRMWRRQCRVPSRANATRRVARG